VTPIEAIILFFFGTLWGSFFYTLALRFSDGSFRENIFKALTGSSRCPACGKRISLPGLIPVFGFLLYRGKCARCGAAVSPCYPAAEALYGGLLVLLAWRQGIGLYTMVLFLIAGTAIAISVIDIKTLTIPTSLVILIALLSIYPLYQNGDIKDHLIAAAAMPLVFIIIILLFPGSFGGGDIKFAAVIGLLMGVEFSIVVLECALVAGSVVGIAYAAKARKGLRTQIPFAPFLSFGLIVAMLFGREIILLYYRVVY